MPLLLRLARGVHPLVLRVLPDQRHHRLVPSLQLRRFPDKRDHRVVDHDRASAAVEGKAEWRKCARERRDVIVWQQQLAETRMRRERYGGADAAWRVREVDGAPLAVMQEVEGEKDRGGQHADCGKGVCREGSANAKVERQGRAGTMIGHTGVRGAV
jgi:hypothetical protein